MNIQIPELALVVLVGASGAGKSSFARRHFLPTEVVSSDFCRGLVCDDENSLEATGDAFALVHYILEKRLARGHLAVVDATNVQKEARRPLLDLARKHYVQCVAIVLDVPETVCLERNEQRPDRQFGPHVVRNHARQLRRSLYSLEKEGFRYVHVLGQEAIENVQIERVSLWNNKKDEHGPFDIIGDVHGCADELETLLQKLGYARDECSVFAHPDGRKAVFLGDLVDRGPRSADVLKLVMEMTRAGRALCVPGNHDDKLKRHLRGKKVSITHGLEQTLASLEKAGESFQKEALEWLEGLISHYVLDDGKLVVAHAGLKAEMQGRAAGAVRAFCLFGETTGRKDEDGLPERIDWARDYRGAASVVYGHTPVGRARWQNNTLNIDTGCVFGGSLTALRWPERELVSVPSHKTYADPARPFLEEQATPGDEMLDLGDFLGKRLIETRLGGNITIQAENGAAALELLSRFAADPRWLLYVPPTMAPVATAPADCELLERPHEAWEYFRGENVPRVICQEKHMGSRAVVVVCRHQNAALEAFGVEHESGVVLTRTGRRFFDDGELETALLERLRAAITTCGWWERFTSDWFVLDAELLPWSAKAQGLLQRQYAPVALAGEKSLAVAHGALEAAQKRGLEVGELLNATRERQSDLDAYRAVTRRYCWTVNGVDDLKLAPFHLLASQNAVHVDKNHQWHMNTLAELAKADDLFVATPYRVVEIEDETSCAAATLWWEELTARGGEGMVIKPLDWLHRGEKGWVQPALKVRGHDYLRLIYGPEYARPDNLERLRARGLGLKRSLASREWALGLEGLERFVRGEGLRRVHECVFATLALESEPVDPRL